MVAAAFVRHGCNLAVVTEPLPVGFLSVSPTVSGSSAPAVAATDNFFNRGLLSHFPWLSSLRCGLRPGHDFIILLLLAGSLLWDNMDS